MAYRFDSSVLVAVFLLAGVGKLTDSQGILSAMRPTTVAPRPSIIGTIQTTVGNSLQSLPSSIQNIVMPVAQTLGLATPPPVPTPWYTHIVERIQELTRHPLMVLRNGTFIQLVPTHIGFIPNVLHPATILQMMDSLTTTTTTKRPSILSTLGIGSRTTQSPENGIIYDHSPVLTTPRPSRLRLQSRPHPPRASENSITVRQMSNAQKKPSVTTNVSSIDFTATDEPTSSPLQAESSTRNGLSTGSIDLADDEEANRVDDGLRELDKLSRVLQEPMLDDAHIRSMVHVDKVPMDEALKDLSAVIKLMTVEHQLTLQSLRIVSIALEKLAKRVHQTSHPEGTYTQTSAAEDTEVDVPENHHELGRRSILDRFRRSAVDIEDRPQVDDPLTLLELSPSTHEAPASSHAMLSSAEQRPHPSELDIPEDGSSPVHLTDSDAPKSRQKRFLFGLGLWGLASLYSPWLWGGYWGGYGYGYYPYYGGYNYYYPYGYGYPYYGYYYPYYPYMPPTQTAAPAAVRRQLKKGKK
ncbi:hypothetical protein BIW11_05710 [Tropilaelaps mercedesae]|uniref:Uncharacterized protein n=1 Tax=Tropilaelaps mercedesae TaxID=418985 RepID=A0A1V9Y164_9ACAR|nr:hypothetical protein BIW11_05710 [Tropilaelaps mercedesae]